MYYNISVRFYIIKEKDIINTSLYKIIQAKVKVRF